MLLKKLSNWANKNRKIGYMVAIACFLLFNGLFLYSRHSGSGSTLFLTGIVIVFWCAICALFFLWRKKAACLHRIFMATLFVLGTLYAVVFPPTTVPDELFHFECSYKYSDYLMLKAPQADSLPIRADDKALIERKSNILSYSLYLEVLDNFEVFSSNPEETTISPVSSFPITANPPQLKLPSAIGITIARLLGLGSYMLYYLGRLFNFAFFAILIHFSIKITPVGKKTMMVITLLPMTLHLASSFSYDAGVIGLSFLLIALCLKAIYTPESLSRKHFVAIIVVAFLLAPCKVTYILLAFAVILIPLTAFSSKRNALYFKASVLLSSFAAVLLFRLTSILELSKIGSAASGNIDIRGEETGHFHSILEFLSDPIGTGKIFIHSLDAGGDFYFSSTIGGSLGWFQSDIIAPWFVVMAFTLLLLISFLKTPGDNLTIQPRHKLLYGAVFCVGFFAILLSMFLGHTFQYESVIRGVQGRYLLPFLPVFALALRSNVITSSKNNTALLLFGMLALNLAYLVRIFAFASVV